MLDVNIRSNLSQKCIIQVGIGYAEPILPNKINSKKKEKKKIIFCNILITESWC